MVKICLKNLEAEPTASCILRRNFSSKILCLNNEFKIGNGITQTHINIATTRLFTIDTLQFSNRMQKAGLQKETADELAEAIKETQSQSLENVATKQDVQLLRQDLKILENDILLKVGKIIYVSTALIIAMMFIAVAVIKT